MKFPIPTKVGIWYYLVLIWQGEELCGMLRGSLSSEGRAACYDEREEERE